MFEYRCLHYWTSREREREKEGEWFSGTVHINPLNAKLNSICHLLALLGAHPILHVSKIRVKAT
jgi:hypothetical protein